MTKKDGPKPSGKGTKKEVSLDDFKGNTLDKMSDADKSKGK
ncbi:hypothetical protein [Octadecabacter ascidiaceicola]|uniref:Uncharacterized protein n=1 Tax=Octadecabacter ascidiaceicola TaxID=1655543 RepID=A0A238KKQ1_9RHOB|nr:hypothetical protein [Octadecabacter ascidiaceicola]SMX43288.1 hypothetical protein OCA8868_02919 [Octadecabacter ascidiaceicola]